MFREVYNSFRYKTVTSDFYFKSSNLKLVHGIKEKLQTFMCEKLAMLLLFLLLEKHRNECEGDFQNKRAQTGSFIHNKGSALMMSCVFELTSSFT